MHTFYSVVSEIKVSRITYKTQNKDNVLTSHVCMIKDKVAGWIQFTSMPVIAALSITTSAPMLSFIHTSISSSLVGLTQLSKT